MESEKMKEIKKIATLCVEKNKSHCTDCLKGLEKDVVLTCRSLLKELLTLINELESENDCKDIEISKQEYQIKKLKDRIAELEEGVAKSMLGCEFLPECTKEKEKEVVEKFTKAVYKELYQLGKIYALPETFDADKYGIFSLTQEVVARIAKEQFNVEIKE